LKPLLIAGIHCGEDRKNEYGVSTGPDFKGWGSKAPEYEQFVVKELLPFIHTRFHKTSFTEIAFAGFSLGALSALDIAWRHPDIFSKVAVFSGSLWWRSVDKDSKKYDPWLHRMMHKQVLNSEYKPGMKFFFQCGELDESEDRNNNRVIDSIDDTIDLMRLLVRKGYKEGKDIFYLQLRDGRHDVATWARALPAFLKWGYNI
jgi:enterochelin esterase-like enzyme